MESFLWIGITFATFSFSGSISVANDVLKMVEMLFGPTDFLVLKFEIILIISSFIQGEMKIESWLRGGKYSKNLLYENHT